MRLIAFSDFLATWGYGQALAVLNLHLLASGFDLPAVGLANALAMLVAFCLGLPAGLLAELAGYRAALILGSLVQSLALLGQVIATSRAWLFLAFAASGLALALFSATKTPALTRLLPPSALASGLGFCRAAASLGGIAGGLTSAWLARQGYQLHSILLLGVLIVCLSPLPLLLLPNLADSQRFYLLNLRKPKLATPASHLLPSFIFLLFSSSLALPYLNVLLDGRGFSLAAIGLSFALWQLAPILSWPLLRVIGWHPSTLRGLLLTTAIIASLLNLALSPPVWWLLIFAWQVALFAAQSSFYAAFSQHGGNALQFASLGMLQTVTSAAATWLGGGVIAKQNSVVFLLVAAITWASLALSPRPKT